MKVKKLKIGVLLILGLLASSTIVVPKAHADSRPCEDLYNHLVYLDETFNYADATCTEAMNVSGLCWLPDDSDIEYFNAVLDATDQCFFIQYEAVVGNRDPY